MNRYFKGVTHAKDDGWLMAGCSCVDNKDYCVTTEGLHADQVPEECLDAKTFSQFVAGLLNAFYNEIDVSKMEAEQVMKMGMAEEELDIPHPDNPVLPFLPEDIKKYPF